jgi:phosphoglycolate phosphatase-like HAD superfamily hydrolase
MLWVFDVDGCLIDSLTGRSLRPGAVELLSRLREAGHDVVLWSAGGAGYAQQRAEHHGLTDHVDAFHGKDDRDGHRRYLTGAFSDDLATVVFVDDRPEDMPFGATVISVSPYISHNPHDGALREVLAKVLQRRGPSRP